MQSRSEKWCGARQRYAVSTRQGTEQMKKGVQKVMHCPCGNAELLALGLCATCYTMKRQDQQHFGGKREEVLDRDERRCRVCGKPGSRKRSVAVHHRVPGVSETHLMITLCLAHHAMVTRTKVLLEDWPALLRQLWREQHPDAHEQIMLDFDVREEPAVPRKRFSESDNELQRQEGLPADRRMFGKVKGGPTCEQAS